MPRLTNSRTGVVVNVSDETAARLSAEWKPAEKATKRTTKKAAEKPSDES